MDLMADSPEEVDLLRSQGFKVDTDDELVTAFATFTRVGEGTARMILSGGDDVVTVDAAPVQP